MNLVSDLVERVGSAPDGVVVLVAALLALLEASAFVGLVIPGETVVLLAGAVTAGDGPPVVLVVAAVTVGSMVGDSLGYLLGRRVGSRLRRSRAGRWVGEERWAAADDAIARTGGRTVALARFVGVAHAVTPAVAGMGAMPYRRFLLASGAGSSVWSTAYVVVGRVTGGSWQRLDGRLRVAIPAAAATVVLVSLVGLWRRARTRRPASLPMVGPLPVAATPPGPGGPVPALDVDVRDRPAPAVTGWVACPEEPVAAAC